MNARSGRVPDVGGVEENLSLLLTLGSGLCLEYGHVGSHDLDTLRLEQIQLAVELISLFFDVFQTTINLVLERKVFFFCKLSLSVLTSHLDCYLSVRTYLCPS